MIERRTFLLQAGAALCVYSSLAENALAQGAGTGMLLSAPLDVGSDWGGSLPSSALKVILRMRAACLDGVALVSDRQPEKLRVEDHSSGPPHIWLHDDQPDTAWIIVDIGTRDWCKLAYQFGHELGHVLCNSWQRTSKPQPPTQWLEESLVEAFSVRGLGLLANGWERDPPFPDDNAFAAAIRDYRRHVIEHYGGASGPRADLRSWLNDSKPTLDKVAGLNPVEGPAIVAFASLLEEDIAHVGDLGALNRWPERTSVPLARYLSLWESSCRERGASGRLPARLRNLLGVEGESGR